MDVITNGVFKIKKKTYHTHLINNQNFSTGDIEIMEYEINEVFNYFSERDIFYPERIYSALLSHMVKIICGNPGLKSKFYFALHQNDPYENPYNIQTMGKDIEVEVDMSGPTFSVEQIINDINLFIDDMEDDRRFFMDELEEKVRLTVVKIEIRDLGDSRSDDNPKEEILINSFRTFKLEQCVICLEKEPKVLFCNCGHICICGECFVKKLNNCPVCKKENTILRTIE